MFIEPKVTKLPPGPESIKLLDEAESLIARTSYTGLYGIALSKGYGNCVEDLDGNIYLDCLGAASANIIGYNFEEVAEAYYQSAKEIQHTGYLYSPNRNALELAKLLTEISPISGENRVILGGFGSDAIGCSIEICRKYTGKMGIIHFKNDYHGSTGLSQQASHFGELNKDIYLDSSDFVGMTFPDTATQMEETLKEIDTLLDSGNYGGVVMEVIQGDAGVVVPSDGFLKRLSDLSTEYNTLLIFDEVQSGMGRTGKWWACEHEGVEPDLLVSAKGLSGGYAPISAVIGKKEIMQSLDPGQQVFTYAGHSPSAATAKKVIEIIRDQNLVDNCHTVGSYLISQLKNLKELYPQIIRDVRGRGLMIGVEIDITEDERNAMIFATRCVELGVYVGYFGINREVVRVEPPITLTKKEVDIIVEVFKKVIDEFNKNSIPKETIDNVERFAVGL